MLENEGELAPQADTRKDILAQQFEEVETAAAAPNPEPAKLTNDDRPRDDKGKFVPKDVDDDRFSPTYGKEKKASAEPELPLGDVPVEPPVWERPPNSWKKDYHDVWKAADPKLREYAYQREEQMRAGIEPLIPKAKFADEVNKVLEPYMGTLRGLGVTPPQAIEALIRTDHTLRNSSPEERRQLFLRLASQYGVNLTPVEGEQPPQMQLPPEVFSLKNELTNLRGEVLSWKEQQERAANEKLQGEITRFGQKHEFFEDVREDMAMLLQSGRADTMEDAYDKAIRLNPELFDQIQTRKQAEEAAKTSAALDAAAKKAKTAAVSVKSSTPGSPTTAKATNRREMLAEQIGGIDSRL